MQHTCIRLRVTLINCEILADAFLLVFLEYLELHTVDLAAHIGANLGAVNIHFAQEQRLLCDDEEARESGTLAQACALTIGHLEVSGAVV